jgi:hypothetical protein
MKETFKTASTHIEPRLTGPPVGDRGRDSCYPALRER